MGSKVRSRLAACLTVVPLSAMIDFVASREARETNSTTMESSSTAESNDANIAK